jgi:hypothetical protein
MRSLSEALVKIEEIDKESDRVAFLHSLPPVYQQASKVILKYMLDPRVKFRLPEGAPPYQESKEDNPGALIYEVGRLYIFTEGGHPTVTDKRLQIIFVDILSSVIPTDAELLIAMKEKRSPYKGLTKSVVKKAWPELFE